MDVMTKFSTPTRISNPAFFHKQRLAVAFCAATSILPNVSSAITTDVQSPAIEVTSAAQPYTFYLAAQQLGYDGPVSRAAIDAEPPAVLVQDAKDPGDFRSWNKPEIRALVSFIEKKYGIEATGMSSWTVPTFSASVSEAQLSALKASGLFSQVEKIDLIEQNEFSEWYDGTVMGTPEAISWGRRAMGIDDNDTTSTANPVYVLDGWIEPNPELNVRNFDPVIKTTSNYAPAHAAHVAGILAAKKNGVDTLGINPGSPLVNVQRQMSDISLSDRILKDAEDRNIFATLNFSSSSSSGYFNLNPPNPNIPTREIATISHRILKRLSTRFLVVQAAGNSRMDACLSAYNPGLYTKTANSNPVDGIMVVGGIDSFGQQAIPFENSSVINPQTTYLSYYGLESGSAYGRCVDAWAPATKIISTWWKIKPTEYLAGTSMAAPHVAGLAARYGTTATRPVQREWWLRSKLTTTGYIDDSARPIMMPNYKQTPSSEVPKLLKPTRIFTSGGTGNTNSLIDGKYLSGNFWNAGAQRGYVTFDLGSVRTIKAVRLTPASSPYSSVYQNAPIARHQIELIDGGSTRLLASYAGAVDEMEPISLNVSTPVNSGRYIRINTVENGVSWTSWREIEIYGY